MKSFAETPGVSSHKFLITFADGQIEERFVSDTDPLQAMAGLIIQLANATPAPSVASIDLMQKGDTPELVKARKTKKRPSRADRFSNAQGEISTAKAEIEELRDELQNWRDAIPENLQDGTKANELDDAISELENVIGDLENAEGYDVNFPGMF
jgi:hypothetical protein